MSSPRELRRRIRSISGTAQITKAMQMVAASKMRKAQAAALAGRPFVSRLYRIQREATTRLGDFTHPLLEVRQVRKRAIILIGADKGLCGALNSNLFRLAAEFDPQSTVFITAGEELLSSLRERGGGLWPSLHMRIRHGIPKRGRLLPVPATFLKKEVDQVQVIATRFINTLTQQALCLEFLPVAEIKALKIPGTTPETELATDTTGALFEPSAEAVLGYMSHHSNINIIRSC